MQYNTMQQLQQWPNAGGRKLNEAPLPPFPRQWASNTQPLKTECEIEMSLSLIVPYFFRMKLPPVHVQTSNIEPYK